MQTKILVSRGIEFSDYTISDSGTVFNKRLGKITPFRIHEAGYHMIDLYFEGKNRTRYIHRLVAEAFIPNPENKPQVNHIDGNKKNNIVSNLEWATGKENQVHSSEILNIKRNFKLTKENAEIIRNSKKSNKILSSEFGVSPRTIQKIKKNEFHKDNNYGKKKFTYEQVEEIKNKRKSGALMYKLAIEYGVSECSIRSIVKNRRYVNTNPEEYQKSIKK